MSQTGAERQARHRTKRKSLGLCLEPGCRAAPKSGHTRCGAHLECMRLLAQYYRSKETSR